MKQIRKFSWSIVHEFCKSVFGLRKTHFPKISRQFQLSIEHKSFTICGKRIRLAKNIHVCFLPMECVLVYYLLLDVTESNDCSLCNTVAFLLSHIFVIPFCLFIYFFSNKLTVNIAILFSDFFLFNCCCDFLILEDFLFHFSFISFDLPFFFTLLLFALSRCIC